MAERLTADSRFAQPVEPSPYRKTALMTDAGHVVKAPHSPTLKPLELPADTKAALSAVVAQLEAIREKLNLYGM